MGHRDEEDMPTPDGTATAATPHKQSRLQPIAAEEEEEEEEEEEGEWCATRPGKRPRQERQAAGAAVATAPPVLKAPDGRCAPRVGKRRWEGHVSAPASPRNPPVEEGRVQPAAAAVAAAAAEEVLTIEPASPSVGDNHQVRRA